MASPQERDEQDEDMVPEGAAVFPLIPEELGVHPLLLSVLHAMVFLIGSSDEVVECNAAEEAAQYLVAYMQRLQGPDLQRIREDMATLAAHARQDKWPEQDIRFLETFLKEFSIGVKPA
jgi:hypothetical protein